MSLSEHEKAIRRRLRDDFPHYAEKVLKIRTKSGEVSSFSLNRAQAHIHERLEEQRLRTGKVRAVLLKGRQQGASTYIAGRFYHQTSHRFGVRTFILTHEDAATQNLFEMVNRYHEHCHPLVRPSTGAANAKELYFDRLDSGYKVGTAGTKGVGRSSTIQLFHGCLGGDVPVVLPCGRLRPMRDIEPGDLVRTHTGQVAAVSLKSEQVKPVYEVLMRGMRPTPLIATGEHRFWTPSGWAELSDLSVGDVIGYPIRRITRERQSIRIGIEPRLRAHGGGSQPTPPIAVDLDRHLGLVMGLYLAEGYIVRQNTSGVPSAVTFAVHRREVDRTLAWLRPLERAGLLRSINVAPRDTSLTVAITAYGRSFAEAIEAACGSKDEKALPDFAFDAGAEFARGLLHGYLSGDGHSSPKRDRRIAATSIRPAITTGIRDLAAALGYGWGGIEFKPGGVRHGRNERDAWTFRLCGEGVDRLAAELGWGTPERKRQGAYGAAEISGGYAWIKIASIETAGEQVVYDIEVDHEDHSYCILHGATHNSEAAFWPHADEHAAGVMQAVPNERGTEVILESTANGVGNFFHQRWQEAERGEGGWQAIFVPWFWQPEYRTEVPDHFEPTDEEIDYGEAHLLDLEQLAWRRDKIRELRSEDKFKQEYPATAAEAFQMSGHDAYIKAPLVMRARKNDIPDPTSGLVIGFDPARMGKDRCVMAWRRGRKVLKYEVRADLDTMNAAGWCKHVLDHDRPEKLCIDVGGLGVGIYDRLVELGYGRKVRAVNFGSAPMNAGSPEGGGPANRRAEIWQLSKEWLEDEVGVDIPDADEVQADACGPTFKYDSKGRLLLEKKEDMLKRGVRSPDIWDAIALTFAHHVAPAIEDAAREDRYAKAERRRYGRRGGKSWMAA